MKPRVLIAGAGICGLTTALAMLRRGFDVQVLEQASELRELGAGLQLSANGTRVLLALGLGEAMRRIVCEPAGKEIRLWNTGQTWQPFDFGAGSVERYGAPYWMVHRGDFHSLLLEAVRACKPDVVRTGATCVGFSQDDAGVTLHLADGDRVTGDVLIGADGVHSKVRQQMFGEGTPSSPASWRGAAWCRWSGCPRICAAWSATTGSAVGGHVVTYPLRRGEILNFVGAVERDDWRVESWTETRHDARNACAILPAWHDDMKTHHPQLSTCRLNGRCSGREPLAHLRKGRVCVMGDAAHPTLPFLAQGANMALEDAMIMTRCLDAFDDVPEALRHYERARLERTAAIVRGSSDNTKRFHNPALANPAGAAAYIDREFQPEKVAQRYDWLFEYDPLSVAV